ncbi:MAG: rhodanese-like domain-containing protein [Calditrichaceae bacterium]|nr:rhodanese-like domain-containing protein [Calditrichaceae bacterium]
MYLKYILGLIIVFSLIVSCNAGDKDLPSMTVEQLQTKFQADSNLFLLDIRTEGEYNGPQGRLDGSMLIPLNELESRIAELEQYKDKEIIVYCRSGNRSIAGTRLLLEYGYNAVNLLGGILAWNALQNP